MPDPDDGGSLSAPETDYTYDAVGNRTSLTDPVGNVTSWVYDAHNRVTEETNELLDTCYFEYDDAGNLTEKTDRNGLVTQFTYDNLYRLTQEVWLDGMTTVNTLDFTYDAAGQMTSASDDNSSYDYTYDGLGRVTYLEIDNGGPLVNFTQACGPNPAFDRGAQTRRLFALTGAETQRSEGMLLCGIGHLFSPCLVAPCEINQDVTQI